MSVPVLSTTTSAGWPATTAAACELDPPYDVANEMPEPAGVAWKAEMSFVMTGFGVE